MKSPVPLMTIMPLPPILWCVWAWASTGTVDQQSLLITLGLIALGWGGAWYLARSTTKLIDHRPYVDVYPDHVTVSDGYEFEGTFSSPTSFIADPIAFRGVMEAVADRAFAGTKKLFSMKESVHIRIWPGTLSISLAEVAAIGELADKLFIDPEVEVVGYAGDDRTAMQA